MWEKEKEEGGEERAVVGTRERGRSEERGCWKEWDDLAQKRRGERGEERMRAILGSFRAESNAMGEGREGRGEERERGEKDEERERGERGEKR